MRQKTLIIVGLLIGLVLFGGFGLMGQSVIHSFATEAQAKTYATSNACNFDGYKTIQGTYKAYKVTCADSPKTSSSVGESVCQKTVRLDNVNVGKCAGAKYNFGKWSNGMGCEEFYNKCSTSIKYCVNKKPEAFPNGVTPICPQDISSILNPIGDIDKDRKPNALDDKADLDSAQIEAVKEYTQKYMADISAAKASCDYGLGGRYSDGWFKCMAQSNKILIGFLIGALALFVYVVWRATK